MLVDPREATQIYWCTPLWNIGFKNIPYTSLSFLQENTLDKDFVLFHIKFDPLKFARFFFKTFFLKIIVFRPLNAKRTLKILLQKKKKEKKRKPKPKTKNKTKQNQTPPKKTTPFHVLFVQACVHQYIWVPPPPQLNFKG